MSFEDDLELQHQPKKKLFEPLNIESLSIEEMKEYIEHAKQEIARTEAEIKNRESLRGDADSLFKN